MTRRLVVPPEVLCSGEVELPEALAHYVAKVLRLGPATQVMLHDGVGGIAAAELRSVDKRRVIVKVETISRSPRLEPRIELLQAVGKGDKLDSVVRAASELGVTAIHPVLTERVVARQDKRLERWRGIADDSIRVAGHAHRPELTAVRPLAEVLDDVRADTRLVFALSGARPLRERLEAADVSKGLALLVGPEGGLGPAEVDAAEAAGFLTTHLGPHTMRTETAGIALAAVAAFWSGRWSSST